MHGDILLNNVIALLSSTSSSICSFFPLWYVLIYVYVSNVYIHAQKLLGTDNLSFALKDQLIIHNFHAGNSR